MGESLYISTDSEKDQKRNRGKKRIFCRSTAKTRSGGAQWGTGMNRSLKKGVLFKKRSERGVRKDPGR